MYPFIFTLHLLAAIVWAGGHLVLALAVLPRALRQRSPQVLLDFEQACERIAMPALAVQVASGLWLAQQLVPDWTQWFYPATPLARAIALKLALLAAAMLMAAHARLRVAPRPGADTLALMAWHVVVMGLLSVGFVLVGVSFRYGGLGF